MQNLTDKVVLITGAASGLGAAVVQQLMEEDVKHVAILDVDEDAGEILKHDMNMKYGLNKTKFYTCDVTNEDAFLRILAEVKSTQGYIDLVINNAGIMNDSWPAFKKEIMLNFGAVVTSSLRAMEMMRRDKGGQGGTIINISSVAALCNQSSMVPVYGATKAAVLQFSVLLGADAYYSRTGVRVITICPGTTNTGLLSPEKMGFFDKQGGEIATQLFTNMSSQTPESAAKGIIDTYKRGKSGSIWLVAKSEGAKEITADIKRAYDVLAPHTTLV